MKKQCLNCRRLYQGAGARCADCTRTVQRNRDARRGTPAQRGYNAEYLRNRRAVLAASDGRCAWGCGRPATTVDHIIPLALGGTNDFDNLMPACKPCNSSRGSRPAPSAWIRRFP